MLISHFMGYQAGYSATGAFDSNFFGLLLVMKQQMQVFQISLVLTLVKTQQTLVNQLCYRWL
jgi:hypothetical protein